MALKVTYKSPGYEKGTEVSINGLGLLTVGEPRTLTEDEEWAFYSEHGDTVKNILGGDSMFDVSGTAEITAKELPKDVNDTVQPTAESGSET